MPERVFITGALGFIAQRLAERYRSLGAEVRGMDLRADPAQDVVAGDISQSGEWQDHAEGCDLFIHTAAIVSGTSDEERVFRVNLLGTRHALDAAARAGAKRFLHFSSVTVFSPWFPDGVDESYPIRASGMPYADSKVAGEGLVFGAHARGELPCALVRPGDVYGPGQGFWTVGVLELLRKRRFILPARGRGIHSPIFIDNLIDGVVRAGEADEAEGEAFTLTDGRGVETREFFSHHHRWLGKPGPRSGPTLPLRMLAETTDRVARRLGIDNDVTGPAIDYQTRTGTYSIEKARSLLGYEPQIGLEEGMAQTEAWLRSEGHL